MKSALYALLGWASAPLPLPNSIQGALAYACLDCHRFSEGADNMRCLCCGSSAIFHVLTVLNASPNPAVQRVTHPVRRPASSGIRVRTSRIVRTRPGPDDAA